MRFAAMAAALLLGGCTGIPNTSGPSQNGALCAASTECGSGLCVDGVCCESTCEGACMSCAVQGSEGRCVAVPDGLNPTNECGSGPCAGSCDGQGACRYPAAEKSCGASLCVGASLESPVCNGAGQCAQLARSCAPYGCEGGACKTSCADPSDCAGAARCLPNGTCEDKLPNGSPCGSGTACASNYCADGVCCNAECGGSCESCNLAGAVGTCTFVAAGQDPANECTGTPPCGASCDGAGQCAFGAKGLACGGALCTTADAPLINRECNGAGQCADVLSSCGLYACEGTSCRTTCTSNLHCRANAFCDTALGMCVARRASGEPCTSAAQCAAGSCTDGVCCNTGCQGECATCNGDTPGVCTLLGVGATPSPACANAGQACGNTQGCPTACSATATCLSTHWCNAGTCVPKSSSGTACNAANCVGSNICPECQSGFCNDGFCCAENCANTSCKSCGLPGKQGTCAPIGAGADGGSPVCPGNYACQSDGTCASGACSTDDDCKPSAYCAGALGCQPRKAAAAGQACTRARECASGLCVDGFCCNGACNGVCEACNLQGTQGSCTAIAASTDPNGECVGGLACNGSRACNTAPCTATSACEPGFVCISGACVAGKPRGATCAATSECGPNLVCSDGVCCDQTCGACRSCKLPGLVGTCTQASANTDPDGDCAGGLTCGASGVCRASCASNAECESGYACLSGACVALKDYGAGCTSGAECKSGSCADNVCCDSACTGGCNACNFPGKLGTCLNYPPGSNPGGTCGTNNACDGNGACGTSCSVDSQCAFGSFCNVNTCTTKYANAQACLTDNQCASNFCVDGVCCNSACTGPCLSCNAAGLPKGVCSPYGARTDPENECTGGLACTQQSSGACYSSCAQHAHCEPGYFCQATACVADLPQGGVCTEDEQCASGHCEDGRCCDRQCTGGCEACDKAGLEGTCSPHAALADPENACTGTFCNGSGACITPCPNDSVCENNYYCETDLAVDACVPQKAVGLQCDRNEECSSSMCVDGRCCSSPCDGVCQSCNFSNPGTCTPYTARTDPQNECANAYCANDNQCIAPCAAEADCKPGFYCNGTACVAKKPNGSACAVGTPAGTECVSGFCIDGFCCNSSCAGSCDRCDQTPGTCTNLPVGTAASCSPYFCQGGANCPTTCSAQSQCASGYYCDLNGTNTCQPKKPTGQSCGGDARGFECSSTFCVDDVCCGSACGQVCEVCDATPGSCTPATAGTDPNNDCGGYVCVAPGTCLNACANDSDCNPVTHYCDGASNTCQPKKTGSNQTCSRTAMCASGFCVDGYCCNSACTGSCDRCDQGSTAQRGTCTNMGTGYAGDPVCAPYRCTTGANCTSTCATDGDCAGSAHCEAPSCVTDYPLTTSCTADNQCQSNNCEQQVCCQTACTGACGSCALSGSVGACSPIQPNDTPPAACGNYLCSGSSVSCPSSCTTDSQCKLDAYCSTSNTCVPDLNAGDVCTKDEQCPPPSRKCQNQAGTLRCQ